MVVRQDGKIAEWHAEQQNDRMAKTQYSMQIGRMAEWQNHSTADRWDGRRAKWHADIAVWQYDKMV